MVLEEGLNSIQLPRVKSAIVGKHQGLDPEFTPPSVSFNMDMGRFDAIGAREEDLIGSVDTRNRDTTEPPARSATARRFSRSSSPSFERCLEDE